MLRSLCLLGFLMFAQPSYGAEPHHILYSQDGVIFTTQPNGEGQRFYVSAFRKLTRIEDIREINLRTMMVIWKSNDSTKSTMADEIVVLEEM